MGATSALLLPSRRWQLSRNSKDDRYTSRREGPKEDRAGRLEVPRMWMTIQNPAHQPRTACLHTNMKNGSHEAGLLSRAAETPPNTGFPKWLALWVEGLLRCILTHTGSRPPALRPWVQLHPRGKHPACLHTALSCSVLYERRSTPFRSNDTCIVSYFPSVISQGQLLWRFKSLSWQVGVTLVYWGQYK